MGAGLPSEISYIFSPFTSLPAVFSPSMLEIFGLAISNIDIALAASGAWLLYKLSQAVRMRVKTTKLCGPPASSWLLGVSREVFVGDSGALFEDWSDKYGVAFQIPNALGSRRTVLFDPRAIAHFYSKETFGYVRSSFAKKIISNIIGKGLLYAEGESHRRQRKALSPGFSNAAIRTLTPVFFDSAYKVKAAWDALLDLSPEDTIIDVQKWMNRVSLDSIGIAGFSHDFGTLEGRHSDVAALFDSFGSAPVGRGLTILLPLLIPTKRTRLIKKLHNSMEEVSEELLARSRKEEEAGNTGGATRSLIGALLKAEVANSELALSPDEVLSQMKVLLLAGYETTSISLTWALLELAQHQEKQERLRKELSDVGTSDPTYDQFTNGLAYLDAVTREVLRLHPPITQTICEAAHDDVVPLSEPVKSASGEMVNSINIAQGASITIPIRGINRSAAIWGPNAKEFVPERWLDDEKGLSRKAKEVQGYHHLLTFVDGPRTCLGRAFAIAEFKSVLSVLIRNYAFAMRDGPETKVELITVLLPRPKIAGEEGYALPMRVRRIER